MQDLRRLFLRSGLAAAAALAAGPVLAKAPLGGGTAVSAHRMKLGDFEVTTLLHGFVVLPPSVLLGDADLINKEPELYEKITAADIHRLAQQLFRTENCSKLYYKAIPGAAAMAGFSGGMDDDDDDDY